MQQKINLKQLFKKDRWFALNVNQKRVVAKVIKKIKENQFILKASNSNLIPKAQWLEIKFKNCLIALETEAYVKETAKKNEFLLKLSEKVRAIWKRKNIRINIYQNTTFKILNKPFFKHKEFPILIEDISASGAKLIVEMPLNEGYLIDLNMDFAGLSSGIKARVVRKKKICQLQTKIYEAGVEFVSYFNNKQKLISYINKKQLELEII